MKVVIAGCGRVGTQIAEMMSMDGHDVVVIDNDPGSFRRLSKSYSGELVEGVAFDEETLRKAGIEEADAFAAVTNFDNANLMAAEVAEKVFGVPRVISRLFNPDKELTFEAMGIDYVCGTTCVAGNIMERLVAPSLLVRSKYAANQYLMAEFDLPRRWEGAMVSHIEEKEGVRFAFLVRSGELLLPNGSTVMQSGDRALASVRANRARRLERQLRR
jgi:trk system potassium uptake protein TrkA